MAERTAHDDGDSAYGAHPPDDLPPEPPGGRPTVAGRIARLPRKAARWCRSHGPETLVGALLIAALGAGIPVLAQQLWPSDSPSAAPTAEPTTCSGAGCSGIDPKDRGCDATARTIAERLSGARLEIRYSPVCKAAWARITRAAVGDSVRISAGGGPATAADVQTNFDAYTRMVPAAGEFSLLACADPDDSDGTPAWKPFCVRATPGDLAAGSSAQASAGN